MANQINVNKKLKKKTVKDVSKDTTGGWAGLIDCKELKKNIYADRLINTRPDVKL